MATQSTPEERFPEVFHSTNIDPCTRKRTTPMKLLCIGMPRSATMSIMAAFEKLGLRSYHMVKAVTNPADFKIWQAALEAKQGKRPPLSRDEWDMVLGDCNATLDFPAAAYMPELIATYPEAKVMIHQREFEAWYKSTEAARKIALDDKLMIPLLFLDPFLVKPMLTMFMTFIPVMFGKDKPSKDDYRRVHTEWHDEVRRIVPNEKLLEFKVADGWTPLCEFLGQQIPNEPFPRVNDIQDFADRQYWIRVVGYRRVWSKWSSTVYALGAIGLAGGVAMYMRQL